MCQRQWLYSILIVLACATNAAQAQLNGDFSDGLDDWTVDGNVSIQTVDPDGAPNNYAIFREPGSGGLSRIYQLFPLPEDTDYIKWSDVLSG